MKLFGYILTFLSIALIACSGEVKDTEVASMEVHTDTAESKPDPAAMKFEGTVSVSLFRTDTVLAVSTPGWGYNLYLDGKIAIHQPHIPAIPGMMPFQSQEDAGAVADLVMFKIENNIMPPSVSIHELDSLGIKH